MKEVKGFAWLVVLILVTGGLVFAGGTSEPEKAELEVVAVMYGHAQEGTWDPSAYQGLLKTQEKLGFELHLNEGTTPQDAEKILRNWASRGVSFIFAHSDIYTDQLITVAKQFPKVNFMGEAQLNPDAMRDDPEIGKYASDRTPANICFAGDTPWDGNYLAGAVAALMSKTKKIGVLQPFEAPPLNRYTNAFLFGAQAINAGIVVKVVFVGDYIAPAETRDAVKSLAQIGCDVVFSEMDDNSAILEAAAQGIRIIPMYMDKLEVDPKAVITSVVMDWAGPLSGAIEATAKGKFADYRKSRYFYPLSVKAGSIYLGKWGEAVPEEVKKKAGQLAEKLKNGSIEVKLVGDKIIK